MVLFRHMTKYKVTMVADSDSTLLATALMFKALGEPTRLRIYNFLRSCCCEVAVEDSGDVRPVFGPTVGEVCCQITGADRINSTISEHLKELREAGLITIERRGRNMICGVNLASAHALSSYLADTSVTDAGNCCK